MGSSRLRGDRGASLVEFALVLPVFFMLLLGMFTGGLAYSRKQSVGQATREGARYGATLPLASVATLDLWLQQVANVTIASGDGTLDTDATVCVAYVPGTGAARKFTRIGTSVVYSNGACFSDGRVEARVQVLGGRRSKLEALVWSTDLTVSAKAVARFEAG